jgi:hypothetical protein
VRGRIPTNLSGGLKARGHPVGGTGLFQICENYLQLTGAFPNPRAQVKNARIGISHSIGGPGNNNYVTIQELSDSPRTRDAVPEPRRHFHAGHAKSGERSAAGLHGARAVIEGVTTIHVTGRSGGPVHVALLSLAGRRVFAKLERAPGEGEDLEQVLAGQPAVLLIKDDGDQYFQLDRGKGSERWDLSRILQAIRRRVPGWS